MLRVGFIGCGNMARYHASVISTSVKGIAITAACDILKGALESFGATYGAGELFIDYRVMLRKAAIDAVCVALPTHLHAAATVAAARAGKHVFCEKPMARSLSQCDAMIEACAKSRVILMIGQVRRYDRDWGTWKKLVESDAIGRPVLWRQTAGGSSPNPWFMDAKMGAGPFMDGCVHNWDFGNFVFGKPVEAVGSLMRLAATTALDSGSVAVRYERGDEITLCWSWALPKGALSSSANDILGPKGVILFPGIFPENAFPRGFDQKRYGAYLVDYGKRKRLVRFLRENMFAAEWRDFRRTVVENQPPFVTGEIGREAVSVALAVLTAGENRKSVRIK